MITLMLILAAAVAGFGLATWRRIAPPPLLLLAGIALNAFGLLDSGPMLQHVLMLGLTFLVFVVGSELDITRVGEHLGTAVRVALAQFSLLSVIGFGVARLLGFDSLTSLYIALSVTASSTLLIVWLLKRRQQLFEPFGRLVVGVLLIQDFLVVLLLPVLTHLNEGPLSIALQVVATLGLLLITGACMRWLAPLLLLRLGLDEESMLLVVLAMLFSFMGLAYLMDVPPVVGAFLAGVAMSGFPVGGVVRGQLTSLADFFLAVFFVTLGAFVTVPDLRQLLLEGILLAGVLMVTPPLVMLIVRRAGLTMRSAVEAAHLLAQCGEFSLVIMLLGRDRGHVSDSVLAAMMMLVVVTTTVTPFLSTDVMTWRLMRWVPGPRRQPVGPTPRDHVLFLGCGTNTRKILQRMMQAGHPVIAVDDDPGVVNQLQQQGISAIRGDGADYDLLEAVGAREAKAIVSTMRRRHDYERLLHYVSGPRVLIRVFDSQEGDRISALGGTPIVESETAAETFLAEIDQESSSPA
jgi:Kef-type K+ transport system membrane component KefB